MWVATQKRRVNPHASLKSKSEKFAPLYENAAVSFSVHPQTRQPYIEVKGTSPASQLEHQLGMGQVGTTTGKGLVGKPCGKAQDAAVGSQDGEGLSVELFKTAMKQLFLTQQKWLSLWNNLFSSLRAAAALIAKQWIEIIQGSEKGGDDELLGVGPLQTYRPWPPPPSKHQLQYTGRYACHSP
ncbi:unnamed protein product [Sphagnum balticum]